MNYTTVKISNDRLLGMLTERVSYWVKDEDAVRLYSQMYEDMIDGGVFEGMELDIPVIVDNDCVNWCSVISKDEVSEDEWGRLVVLYRNGQRDFSCEGFSDVRGSFIEAMNETEDLALIRA